jgi:hypothetical protein
MANLHPIVVGSSTAFGTDPDDVFIGVHDVASLAVDAVGGIELQVLAEPVGIIFHLIYGRRAVILAGITVLARAPVVADIETTDPQVGRLILFMMRSGMVNVLKLIEGQLAIWPNALDGHIGKL